MNFIKKPFVNSFIKWYRKTAEITMILIGWKIKQKQLKKWCYERYLTQKSNKSVIILTEILIIMWLELCTRSLKWFLATGHKAILRMKWIFWFSVKMIFFLLRLSLKPIYQVRVWKKFKELFPDKVKLRIRFSLNNLKLDGDVLNIPLFMADQMDRLIGLALECKQNKNHMDEW